MRTLTKLTTTILVAGSVLAAAPVAAAVPADTTPPTTPTNLRQTGTDANGQPVVAWDPSTDDSGVISRYRLQVVGGPRAFPRQTTYEIRNFCLFAALKPGQYTITVAAIDPSQNRSAPSEPLEVTLLPLEGNPLLCQ